MRPEKARKGKLLNSLSEENGVAIVVIDERNQEISLSNNNSVCRALSTSKEFNSKCGEFCGKAFANAYKADGPVNYECYAGLTCRAMPVADAGKRYVAIIGRTFLTSANYRKATEKAINGEWKMFRPTEFFENVLISSSTEGIDRAATRLAKFSAKDTGEILDLDIPKVREKRQPGPTQGEEDEPSGKITALIEKFAREAGRPNFRTAEAAREVAAWRSLLGSLMQLEYRQACTSIVNYLAGRYNLESLVWFVRRGDRLEPVIAKGGLRERPIKLGISADNSRLFDAVQNELPLVLRERVPVEEKAFRSRNLNLFPIIVGGEVRAAIGVEGSIQDPARSRYLSRFCQSVGPQMEILRLRSDVSEKDWLAKAVRRFNESLKKIDADDFWQNVTQVSAELLQAERASLLVQNEKTDSFNAKAAIGARVNLFSEQNLGRRIARRALQAGSPFIVPDIKGIGIESAPNEWRYKTTSFISYPILIGERRLAVLNFTDKAGGGEFGERDLELLQAIAPQIAVAIDRTSLKDKAGEFQQLSVTDPLTGLLNRRYLEERLTEEIQRSKRHRFPMSLMMMDVDEFKSYNDNFGHPAGDIALRTVADILKETLRGADVAARYGGEEFAILLPQTTSAEAAVIAERIRQRIEVTEFPKRKVTVSIGIASCSAEIGTPEDIINAADNALYEAKNHGRNNVQIYDSFGGSLNDKIH